MEIKIKELYENGLVFYPVTHVEAVKGLEVATETENGLMSASDKIKLNNIKSTGSGLLGSVFYKEVKMNDTNNSS